MSDRLHESLAHWKLLLCLFPTCLNCPANILKYIQNRPCYPLNCSYSILPLLCWMGCTQNLLESIMRLRDPSLGDESMFLLPSVSRQNFVINLFRVCFVSHASVKSFDRNVRRPLLCLWKVVQRMHYYLSSEISASCSLLANSVGFFQRSRAIYFWHLKKKGAF